MKQCALLIDSAAPIGTVTAWHTAVSVYTATFNTNKPCVCLHSVLFCCVLWSSWKTKIIFVNSKKKQTGFLFNWDAKFSCDAGTYKRIPCFKALMICLPVRSPRMQRRLFWAWIGNVRLVTEFKPEFSLYINPINLPLRLKIGYIKNKGKN